MFNHPVLCSARVKQVSPAGNPPTAAPQRIARACSVLLGLVLAACSTPVTPTAPSESRTPLTGVASAEARQNADVVTGLERVTLCHAQDDRGRYIRLTVSVASVAVHRAHGDGAAGEQLPNDPALSFNAECIPSAVTMSTLVSVMAGTVGTFNFAGQSVTTPSGGPFNNLRFNWYQFSGNPTSFGTLYLLTQEYLGLPGGLSPSTAGFVGRSQSIVNDEYRFAPSVSVSSSTQYWFYTDTQGSFVTSFFGSTYAGGDLYVTGVSTFPFHKALAAPGVFLDANFKLQGAALVTPP